MLESLRLTSQAINEASDLKEAMRTLVARVLADLNADCCHAYLYHAQDKDYLLAASSNPDMNRNCVKSGEGLVGILAQRADVINLQDAKKESKELIKTPVEAEVIPAAFLGVPIVHKGAVLGLLVVGQDRKRLFTDSEEAFLVTLAAHIAATTAEAIRAGKVEELFGQVSTQSSYWLHGESASKGVAIGKASVVYAYNADFNHIPEKTADDPVEEVTAFNGAILSVRKDIEAMMMEMSKVLPVEEQVLFDAYLQILDGDSLKEAVIAKIKNGGVWAQYALRIVIQDHIQRFESMEDAYLRERAMDIKDIGQRLLVYLQAQEREVIVYPQKTVLVGSEITPSMLAEVPKGRLKGVVTIKGGQNSHVSILARALGIPVVLGVSQLKLDDLNGQKLIVDGYSGRLHINPNAELERAYKRLIEEEKQLYGNLRKLKDAPSQTSDGCPVKFQANTAMVADIGPAQEMGAMGVGLYRTEVPFMMCERFPSEDEQRIIYHQLLQAFSPYPVTMRTLDVGGDKTLPYFFEKETNPFLGWRGIRMMLDHTDILVTQIRAMLKASIGLGNLKILLPMISNIDEIKSVKRLLTKTYYELQQEGLEIEMPKLGVMIEVPAAVYQVEAILHHVDYVSVGSNDLTQYILAVDRDNARVSKLYDSLHPAVLSALAHIAKVAQDLNKPASICGEIAGDPLAAPILVGMGYRALSMNPYSLLPIKWIISETALDEMKTLLQTILKLESAEAVRSRMRKHLVDAGFGGLVRAGRY